MPGKLIYLMGPSGSGKDSLIEAVRPHLAGRRCEVMRRVITRSAEAVGEDAVGVSREAFESLKVLLPWTGKPMALLTASRCNSMIGSGLGVTCWLTAQEGI